MRNQQSYAPALFYPVAEDIKIVITHTLNNVLSSNARQLHLCHHIVADIMIKLTLNLTQFMFALLRE